MGLNHGTVIPRMEEGGKRNVTYIFLISGELIGMFYRMEQVRYLEWLLLNYSIFE